MISKELEEQLITREKDIVAAQKRCDFSAVEAMLAEGFHEIGGSGKLFSRSDVLRALRDIRIIDYTLDQFRILPANPGCVIVTYMTSVKRSYMGQEYWNRAYRSSTWIEQDGAWRVIFHQATPLPAAT
jgi:hypothetical protein